MPTISETIIEDHKKLKEEYNNILNAQDNDTKERWQNQFVWQIARHSIAEELVIYPAFEKHLGEEGKKMVDSDLREHQSLKEKLVVFQKLKATDSNFDTTIKEIIADLDHHMGDEEEDDLPPFEKAISTEESIELSKQFDRYKALAPSRSHPNAPDKPPFETAFALLTAPIDQVTDWFRRFPEEQAK